jgi:hypothetical protein
MAAEKLKKLHTALIDTRDAYELALKDTKDPDVAAICREADSGWSTIANGLVRLQRSSGRHEVRQPTP